MHQILATVVALAAITGATIYEGIRFGLWNDADPAELAYFTERLTGVPESFGDWTSEPAPEDAGQLAAAEVRGHVSRIYENRKTGAKVNVFLACGKTHPMSIHSPDACYAATGFTQGDTNRRWVDVNGRMAEFWAATFNREAMLQRESLDIAWAWAPGDGLWQAPTNPRPHFSDKDALFKLYVITRLDAQSNNQQASEAFLAEFLPLIDKILFEAEKPELESAE
jgi:hypothetical protein